jgi:hypothetical protein
LPVVSFRGLFFLNFFLKGAGQRVGQQLGAASNARRLPRGQAADAALRRARTPSEKAARGHWEASLAVGVAADETADVVVHEDPPAVAGEFLARSEAITVKRLAEARASPCLRRLSVTTRSNRGPFRGLYQSAVGEC